jgi:hypothetical protein
MSTPIAARRERVWRALTDPAELLGWDERLLGSVDAPADYPCAGQHVRWRYRLGKIPLVLHERLRTVVAPERLHASLALGSFHLEQTYTLLADLPEAKDAPPRTRLGLKLAASNAVPLLGAEVDRFAVRRMAADRVDSALRALQRWCEDRP